MSLLRKGWQGSDLTIVEPSGKTEDDRTWSYWARESLLPASVEQATYSNIIVSSDGMRQTYALNEHQYFSVRSSSFYTYAKGVLAKAGVNWIAGAAKEIKEQSTEVAVILNDSTQLSAEYVLDSRPPKIEVPSELFNATLQHFGGWFVEMETPVFNPGEVVFMDFISIDDGVAFFYVIPTTATTALVEIAVFSAQPWEQADYDTEIAKYIQEKYRSSTKAILEREYGVIPMTDQPFWKDSTKRVWNIGTRGGWVQPSSGYAFTRTARFANEVAERLLKSTPEPWKPSSTQQVFNAVMLGYIIDNPEKAGSIFFNLFKKNGPTRTFDFLDECASVEDTIKLMWSSPQLPFAVRAVRESAARLIGSK